MAAAVRSPERVRLTLAGWVVLGVFLIVIAAAWTVTALESSSYGSLIMNEVAGAVPTDRAEFIALSGVMMLAMMLPSAIPMVTVYRDLASSQSATGEGGLQASIFSVGYLLLWTGFTTVALLVLVGLGLLGGLGGLLLLLPGLLLVTAGVYQFSRWKRSCLQQCQSPLGFVMTHWRSGRWGALRMGLDHGVYCTGCCWLLMLVVFVTGAMSLLWMGAFSALILAEKISTHSPWFSRGLGGASIAVGALLTSLAATTIL